MHQEFTDYYKLLGISPNASAERIKHAYHKLALKYHPDKVGSAVKMSQINEAYSVLSNEMLKANYDSIYEQFHSRRTKNSKDIEHMNALVQLLVAAKKSATAHAFQSAGWLVLGIIVTAVSYTIASPGGHYVLATGAMLFGGYQFIVGIHHYFNPQLLIKKKVGITAYNKMFKDVPIKTSWKTAWIVLAFIIVGSIAVGASISSSRVPYPSNNSVQGSNTNGSDTGSSTGSGSGSNTGSSIGSSTGSGTGSN